MPRGGRRVARSHGDVLDIKDYDIHHIVKLKQTLGPAIGHHQDNLLVLCKPCHAKQHGLGAY